jgi:hypothetical protein
MVTIAKNRFIWADEVDEEQEYDYGRDVPNNTKLIAFWIHFIDTALREVENSYPNPSSFTSFTSFTEEHVRKHVSQSLYTYIGAAREGYHLLFRTMPTEVKLIVGEYFSKRNKHNIACDHIFLGTEYPFCS